MLWILIVCVLNFAKQMKFYTVTTVNVATDRNRTRCVTYYAPFAEADAATMRRRRKVLRDRIPNLTHSALHLSSASLRFDRPGADAN